MPSKKKELPLGNSEGRDRAMSQIVTGNQIFHNGIPVQLLSRIRQFEADETWRVRPLFVEGPNRNVRFRSSDRISFIVFECLAGACGVAVRPARTPQSGTPHHPSSSWAGQMKTSLIIRRKSLSS